MGFRKTLKQIFKKIGIVLICGLGSLTLRPRKSFATEPLPIVKIVEDDIERFNITLEISPGKTGQATINFRNRTPKEQVDHDKKEQSELFRTLRHLEGHKRYDEEGKINRTSQSLNGSQRFMIREELPIDSPLRNDHYDTNLRKMVKGRTHRIRSPYYQKIDNLIAKKNNELEETIQQLKFENQKLKEQLNKKK